MSYLEELGANESHGTERRIDPNSTSRTSDKPCVTYGGTVVGDLIQWEADGVLRLEKPTRVRAVQEHDGKQWVFVDGSESGIPMEQVIVEQKGGGVPAKGTVQPPKLSLPDDAPAPKNARKEVFALDEGDVVITFPSTLSAASYDDLESYLKVFLRKAKRGIEIEAARKAMDGEPD